VRGHARAKTIEDVSALRYIIGEATQIMRAAEDALEAARPKRPTTAPTSERAVSFQARRDAAKALRKAAARAALTVYDTVLIQGRRIGDVWYSELEALRAESAFAASLCDQLMRHGRPSAPTRVRDLVSQETLAAMVERAKRQGPMLGACHIEHQIAGIMVRAVFAQSHKRRNPVLTKDYPAAVRAVRNYRECVKRTWPPQWVPLPRNVG
jgi:hypothetical protein